MIRDDRQRRCPAPPSTSLAPAAWHRRAQDLARWAWARLVNRVDAWGGYNRVEDRARIITRPDGSTYPLGPTLTRPARRHRGKILLTPAILTRHFRARSPLDVVGLHTTAPGDTSKWGTVEIDWHGPDSSGPAANEAAAIGWHDELRRRGFRPLLWDSNGQGGFHLDVLLAAAVPTPRLYHFLRRLVADHARHGLPAAPETFPKQPQLVPRADGSGAYGNWVRVVGRHHTRPHWARVWDGARWLDEAQTVAFVLDLAGDDPGLIPEAPQALPPQPARHYPAGGSLAARIAAYCRRLPNLAAGQGRDAVAYGFACWLARDMALSDDVALSWLVEWDRSNSPPKGEAALREILNNAKCYGRNPAGCGRGPEGPARDRHGHVILTRRAEVG